MPLGTVPITSPLWLFHVQSSFENQKDCCNQGGGGRRQGNKTAWSPNVFLELLPFIHFKTHKSLLTCLTCTKLLTTFCTTTCILFTFSPFSLVSTAYVQVKWPGGPRPINHDHTSAGTSRNPRSLARSVSLEPCVCSWSCTAPNSLASLPQCKYVHSVLF